MKTHYNVHLAEVIQTGLDHPECLNFGPDGRLYAGGFSGQVYVMTPPDFEVRLLGRSDGFIAGVAVDGDDNVYLCHTGKRSVLRMNQKGVVSVFCDRVPDGPVIYPNYGVFDVAGDYYFSDSGSGYWIPNGRLIKVKPNGATESLIGGCLHFPNGLAMSPIDGSLFMIETTAADVLRVPINKDTSIGQPEIYVQLQGNELDGLAFAKNGDLYVSCYYPNRIFVVHPDRNIELLIEDTTGETLNQPTNVAFEPNGTRLFFGNLGGQHIGALDVGEHGAALCYPTLRKTSR